MNDDIAKLVSFLPTFTRDDFNPYVDRGEGRMSEQAGGKTTFVLDYPEYVESVEKFIAAAGSSYWRVPNYREAGGEQINAPGAIAEANLDECRAMITFALRGEHFVAGWIGSALENGTLQLVLRRLEVLARSLPANNLP